MFWCFYVVILNSFRNAAFLCGIQLKGMFYVVFESHYFSDIWCAGSHWRFGQDSFAIFLFCSTASKPLIGRGKSQIALQLRLLIPRAIFRETKNQNRDEVDFKSAKPCLKRHLLTTRKTYFSNPERWRNDECILLQLPVSKLFSINIDTWHISTSRLHDIALGKYINPMWHPALLNIWNGIHSCQTVRINDPTRHYFIINCWKKCYYTLFRQRKD